jgi:hypothetical protein
MSLVTPPPPPSSPLCVNISLGLLVVEVVVALVVVVVVVVEEAENMPIKKYFLTRSFTFGVLDDDLLAKLFKKSPMALLVKVWFAAGSIMWPWLLEVVPLVVVNSGVVLVVLVVVVVVEVEPAVVLVKVVVVVVVVVVVEEGEERVTELEVGGEKRAGGAVLEWLNSDGSIDGAEGEDDLKRVLALVRVLGLVV